MAANLREVKLHHKRKLNELEDITNSTVDSIKGKPQKQCSKKQRVTFAVYDDHGKPRLLPPSPPRHHGDPPSPRLAQQQRSPSPTSPAKSKNSADTIKPQNRSDPYYQSSPLLTPKDEEDDEEDDPILLNSQVTPPTSSPINEPNEIEIKTSHTNLTTNTDYIALTSSLRLANNNRTKIQEEIVQLSSLLKFHSQNNNKDEIISFFMKLINNDLKLPQQHKILKAPVIDWSKYHPSLGLATKDFEKHLAQEKNSTMFKSLELFKKSTE